MKTIAPELYCPSCGHCFARPNEGGEIPNALIQCAACRQTLRTTPGPFFERVSPLEVPRKLSVEMEARIKSLH
jgi:hypothetical protein